MVDPMDDLIQFYEKRRVELTSELAMVDSRLAGLKLTKASSAFPMPHELKGTRGQGGKKRNLSPEVRKMISDKQKARWAKYRHERDKES